MAIKIWNQDPSGPLTSTIRKLGSSSIAAEEHRSQADEIDVQIDHLLDKALALLDQQDTGQNHNRFATRWAIGRAIAESDILKSPHLQPGETPDLWLAMARKCRLGVRHTGEPDLNSRWKGLIFNRPNDPDRIEDDVFGLGMWLQEQELDDAKLAFGSSIHNAKQIWSGEALRSPKLRQALTDYFAKFNNEQRQHICQNYRYAVLAKALRHRWPSRGRGSAKRPVHYEQHQLVNEISDLLDPLTAQILAPDQAHPIDAPTHSTPTASTSPLTTTYGG